MPTLVEVASNAGTFTTLVQAVQAAGLEETLAGSGPFTVFAPTDEAFAKLPAGTLEGLLSDNAQLTKVLTYHVVSGKGMAADVQSITSAPTVEGSALAINASGDTVKVNDALVTQADIEADNGVIHVIDTVLVPS